MKRILTAGLLLISCTNLFTKVTEDFTDNSVNKEPVKRRKQKNAIAEEQSIGHREKDFGEDAGIKSKMENAKKHVDAAVEFFSRTSLGESCRAFEKDDRWHAGEFSIFVFGADGTCYLFGNELLPLWENFSDIEKSKEIRGITFLGEAFIDDMLAVGKAGGWVSFDWNYSTKYSYVRTISKGGSNYIIGTGFYPESPKFLIRQLIGRAIRFGSTNGATQLFRKINNSLGDFVKGDAYLWAYDMEMNAFAHGRNIATTGQNRLNWKDSSGKYRNKIILELIEKQGSGWIDYNEDGIEKNAYIESFTDPKTGERYIVGGGYYPHLTDDTIVSFVKRGVTYLKSEGAAIAFRDFTSRSGGFIRGPLRLFALDLDGTVLSDGENPIFIGQNLMNNKDVEGKYMIRDMIKTAKKSGRGWVTYVDNSDYKTVYVELVEVPDGKYVIGSGYWPSLKEHTASSLAQKAATFMDNNEVVDSLRKFIGTSSEFLRGDLFVSVYTENGICLAHGLDRDRIWFNEMAVFDKKGFPVIEHVIDTAKRGGGWVEYEQNGQTYRAYTKLVNKKNFQMQEARVIAEEPIKKGKYMTRKAPPKQIKTDDSFIISVGYFK